MKKILALILITVMLTLTMSGCGDSTSKGATIPVYISDQIINFDPAFAYTDDAAAKILPLIYEGLTRIDSKGNVQNALLSSYTYKLQQDGDYLLECNLKTTFWSDGVQVSADDFVFAYKRIMDPEFTSEAYCLLRDLKNAKEVKSGDMSIDDLGVRAADTTVLQFLFDKDINVNEFLEKLASPMLYPLRERVVLVVDNWSSNSAILVSNGPFAVKSIDEGKSLMLERSSYYYRDIEKDALDKSVTPYRLKIIYNTKKTYYSEDETITSDELGELALYNDSDKLKTIVFNSNLPLEKRAETNATLLDMLTQHVYYFNTDNALFKDAKVRKALSMAIDRNEIVNIVTYATASEGWVANGVYSDYSRKTTFRSKYGKKIEAEANVTEAKNLLKQAGVSKGSFTISCKNSAVEKAIANYVAEVWKGLGFDVEVKTMGYRTLSASEETKFYELYEDRLARALSEKNFDVIALDYTSPSTYPWGSIAQFATGYTGVAIDLKQATENENYSPDLRHVTGWKNTDFDKLIADAEAETNLAAKSDILSQAEDKLLDEMPVIPLIQYKNGYIKKNDLSNIDTTYYGAVTFTKAKLAGYKDYVVETVPDYMEEETEEQAEEE